MMTPEIKDLLKSLPPEAVSNLSAEHKALLSKELRTSPQELLTEDLDLVKANLILLRVASLLTSVDVADGHTWNSDLESLSMCEDKELLSLLKKLIKHPVYKLRASKKTEVQEETADTDNPLLS